MLLICPPVNVIASSQVTDEAEKARLIYRSHMAATSSRVIFPEGLLLGGPKRHEVFSLAQNGPKFFRDFASVAPSGFAAYLYVLHVNLHAQGTPQCIAQCISGEAETLAILGFQDISDDSGSPGQSH
ncbi:hypothetical protein ACFSQQ_16605 [Mesorhizobium kowhaii]|uniref:hypothetical protein n=1 Tax=Mesorhizobium kowhaii TaxID=1300272 RepID=UPI0035E8FD9A